MQANSDNTQLRIMHTVRHRKRRRGKGLTAKGWKRGRPSSWYGGSSRRGTITADQFTWERQSAGLTREGAADLLGVGLRTIGHWEAGHTAPSYAAFKLLRVFRQGEFIHPAWDGYRLVRGVLVTPERREFSPADLGWLGLLVGRAKLAGHIAKERDRLRDDLAGLREKASAASLGLVYSATSDTPMGESLVLPTFQASWRGPIMGPQWGHEDPTREAQPSPAGGPEGPTASLRGQHRHFPQRGLRPGPAELPAVRNAAGSRLRQGHPAPSGAEPSQRSVGDGGEGKGLAATSGAPGAGAGTAAARGAERSVPVWQRQEGQALPPGVDLLGGVA